jgi:thiamine biosynthesis lipoprotein
MSVELANLTRRSLRLRELSDGLFDPTIGMLVELWGFGDGENMPAAPPAERAIQDWLELYGTGPDVQLNGRSISADKPVKLTFGAIAKGTALNGAAALLTDMGIENALISAGGDLKVLGHRGNRSWRIGIRDPHSAGLLGAVSLAPGEAIVTSGDYERFFEYQGRQYHHLLDPLTGRPVDHTAGVTVIHADAELADAAATALMVAGAPRFHSVAIRMGIVSALLVSANGDIIMTPELAERIREPAQTGDSPGGIM